MENSLSLYCHFYTDNSKGVIKTIKLKLVTFNIRVIELKERIKKELETKDNNMSLLKFESVSKTILSKPLSDSILISNFFEDRDDIFCKVDLNITPIKKTPNDKTNTQCKTLSNYSYYELNINTIKVLIPLKDAHTIPKENIKGTFTETSCEVKANLNGINYYFAVPRLHCSIIPETSVVTTSTDNLVFKLRKAKESDNWASLFKMKFVGETD
jgi:hypothetical protein